MDRVEALESAANAARARDGNSFLQIHGDRPASHFDSETNANERRVSDEEHVDTDERVEKFESESQPSMLLPESNRLARATHIATHIRSQVLASSNAHNVTNSNRLAERYALLKGFSLSFLLIMVQFDFYETIFMNAVGASTSAILGNFLVMVLYCWSFVADQSEHKRRIANGFVPGAAFGGFIVQWTMLSFLPLIFCRGNFGTNTFQARQIICFASWVFLYVRKNLERLDEIAMVHPRFNLRSQIWGGCGNSREERLRWTFGQFVDGSFKGAQLITRFAFALMIAPLAFVYYVVTSDFLQRIWDLSDISPAHERAGCSSCSSCDRIERTHQISHWDRRIRFDNAYCFHYVMTMTVQLLRIHFSEICERLYRRPDQQFL